MKKFILTAAFIISLTSPALADYKINLDVNGMICDFCAQSILKVFEEHDGFKSLDVNMDEALVTIIMEDGSTLTDEEIKQKINYAGYDLVKIKRLEEK